MKDVVDRSRLFAMVPYDIIKEIENGNAIALYAVLKMYAGSNQNAFPSRSRLAKHLGYKSPRMVDLALDRLTELGLVRIIPRFKDDHGNIGYERTDEFREQTSNGYVIYDRIARQDQLQFDTPLDTGVHTPTHPCAYPLDTGVHTPYTPVLHEGYSLEGYSSEGDTPCSPPSGERFEEFWGIVPKKAKKRKAKEAFEKAIKRADPDTIIDGMRRYANDPNLPDPKGPEARYILHPATWLNGDCWEDDPLPVRRSTKQGSDHTFGTHPDDWNFGTTADDPNIVEGEVLQWPQIEA